jgi:phage gp36-like protein
MAYCAKADILERISEEILIQLTDDYGSGAVEESVVTRAIVDADAEIDAYCGDRYSLPFNPVPAIIRKVSADIAIHNLYARREATPDDQARRYDNAIKFLGNLAKGLVSLGADAPAEAESKDTVSVSAQDRTFTKDTLEGY